MKSLMPVFITAVLCASLTHADVVVSSAGGGTDGGNGYTWVYSDLAGNPPTVTPNVNAVTASGTFTNAINNDSFSYDIDGYHAGWTGTGGLTASTDMRAYISSNLSAGAIANLAAGTGFGVYDPNGSANNQMNTGETLVFTFNTDNLSAGYALALKSVAMGLGGGADAIDLILWDSNAVGNPTTVIASGWDPGTSYDLGSVEVHTGDILVIGISGGTSRFDGLGLELVPVEIQEPIQHLDATVTNSVTGSPVTQWADLSGNTNHAVSALGHVTYPSTSLSATGLAGLDFGSGANSLELFSAAESTNWLDQTSSNGFAVLVAFKCDDFIAGWNDLIGNTSAINSGGFFLRYGSSGDIVSYLGDSVNVRSGHPIQAGDTVVLALNYDAAAGSYTLWDSNNGDSITDAVAPTNFALGSAVTIGRTTSGNLYFNGMVGEVKVFDTALSADRFQSEYEALAAKWAVVGRTFFVNTAFQDNMVLQRDLDVPVWGTALAGAEVVVKLDGVVVDTITADAEGKWLAHIGSYPHDGGVAHALELSTEGEETIVLTNVVFGDVYLAAGQSNMFRTMRIAWGADDEAATANYPLIRELTIAQDSHSRVPYENAVIKTNWRECSPSTAKGFSATAYFFAKNLYLNTGVPVGLINASWGAHQIMHFIAPEGVAAVPELAGLSQQLVDGPEPTNPQGVYFDVYNSMIHPLVPYGIRGFVWYQCEWDTSSASNRQMYHQKMRALMAGWREIWGQGDLPFYYVQLPTWEDDGTNGAFTRESQLFALSETNAGMAVTIDAGAFPELEVKPGTTDDPLHPANKQDVGKRLALWAQRDIHGQDVVPSGPLFKEAVVEGGHIRVSFDYAAGLFGGTKYITNAVVASAAPLDNFEIAGADGVFVAADAVIDGQTVVVSSASVSAPVDVRYCFKDWPDHHNVKLYNSAALPAIPFRTDVDYGLVVINGSGDGWYDEGETASIVADAPASGKVFDRWVGLPAGIADPTASSTTLTMPAHQTYLMAVYRDSTEPTYTLTVNQGAGDGPSKAGSFLAVLADPAPQGYRFSGWTGDTQTVENVSAVYTTLTMPQADISISPTYVPVWTPYDVWAASHGLAGGAADDDDGDGVDNLAEYAIDGNPTNAMDRGTFPFFSYARGTFNYIHPQRSDDPGLVYTVETSTNLVSGSWTNQGCSVVGTHVTGGTLDFVTNEVNTGSHETFIRLMIGN